MFPLDLGRYRDWTDRGLLAHQLYAIDYNNFGVTVYRKRRISNFVSSPPPQLPFTTYVPQCTTHVARLPVTGPQN